MSPAPPDFFIPSTFFGLTPKADAYPVNEGCAASTTLTSCEHTVAATERLKVARGASLFREGDRAGEHIFAILYGSFKCSRAEAPGPEQIFGFRMRGDYLGLDTIGRRQHTYNLTALEDSAVCVIALDGAQVPLLSMHLLISEQIANEQGAALVLRNNGAESKLASFLLDLSCRHQASGFSRSRFRLSMERQEVANYLALSPASISRAFRKLRQAGSIDFVERDMTILDRPVLQAIAEGASVDWNPARKERRCSVQTNPNKRRSYERAIPRPSCPREGNHER